jgi:hypothetical protein
MKKQNLDIMLYGAVMAVIVTSIIFILDFMIPGYDLERHTFVNINWKDLACLFLWTEWTITLSNMYVVKICELVNKEQA